MEFNELSLKEKLEFLSGLPKEEKEAILPELLSLYELRDNNPLMFFEPYTVEETGESPQTAFLEAKESIKMFVGGNRTGKTTIGMVDNLIQCLDRGDVPEHLQQFKKWDPPFYCRIVSTEFGQSEAIIHEKIRELCPPHALVGGSFDKAFTRVPLKKLRFKNGSWIQFNAAEQEVHAFAGVKLHRVHFDEEPKGQHGYEVYQENKKRLWDYAPNSQLIVTMTPKFGSTWIEDEIWACRDEPGIFGIKASSLGNPHISRDAIRADMGKMSKEEFRSSVEGDFISMHGLVLERFSEKHKVDKPRREHIQQQQVYVGIDPGITQGGVVWAAFDRDNNMLVFDELYPRDKGIAEIAREIKTKNADWGIEPIYVIDPSARNRSLVNAESVQGEFYRQGIFPLPGQNDRLASVLQLRARIDSGSFLVSRNCQSLIKEITRWAIAKDEDTERYAPKIKGAGGTFATIGPDHLIDPVRYIAMNRVWYVKPKDDKRTSLAWNQIGPPEPVEQNVIDY